MMGKRITLLLILLVLSCGLLFAQGFNDRGVWHSVDSATLAHGQIKTFGIRDVSDRAEEITILLYGTTTGDSLKAWLRIYGMMSALLADTTQMVLVYEDSSATAGNTIVYADTLVATSAFPHLYGRLSNNHADSTAIMDLYIYARPKDVTIIRN